MVASAELLPLLDEFSSLRVGVIGDLIADRYIHGLTSRVSREAPVLILQQTLDSIVPGGAANAAANACDLGARVACVGHVGSDGEGEALVECLRSRGVDMSRVLRLDNRMTTTKTRILAGGHHTSYQQVVRIDKQSEIQLADSTIEKLVDQAIALRAEVDVVIASDYGVAVFTPRMIDTINNWDSRRAGPPVLVDSQFQFPLFRDVTAITPNEPEASAASGVPLSDDRAAIGRMAEIMLSTTRARYVLITQGRAGMSLFSKAEPRFDLSIFGDDEVSDVTGAGDTVIATLALGLAAGAPARLATALANVAAGLVVQKRGTATVTPADVRQALLHQSEVPG